MAVLIGGALLLAGLACNLPGLGSGEVAQAPEEGAPPPAAEKQGIDCGEDLDCFILAAQSCAPAHGLFTTQLDMFGVLVSSTAYEEIRGLEEGKCVLYIRTEAVQVEYTEAIRQQLLDSGMSEADIESQRAQAEQQAMQEAFDDTCKFEQADLIELLTRWRGGSFSSEDWDVAECEGKLLGGD